jgi:hypothetical protein
VIATMRRGHKRPGTVSQAAAGSHYRSSNKAAAPHSQQFRFFQSLLPIRDSEHVKPCLLQHRFS